MTVLKHIDFLLLVFYTDLMISFEFIFSVTVNISNLSTVYFVTLSHFIRHHVSSVVFQLNEPREQLCFPYLNGFNRNGSCE